MLKSIVICRCTVLCGVVRLSWIILWGVPVTLSTLCRWLWTLRWKPVPATWSTMNPTWRTLWATPELWWALLSVSAFKLSLCVSWMLLSSLLYITSHIMDLCFHHITASVLEACPYRLHSFSSQLITEPFFIITATMGKGWEASASLSLSFICVRWITDYYCDWRWVSSPFYFLLLTPRCSGFCCVLFSVHSFVNRLSKDLVGAAVQAQLHVIDQTDEPHAENLIS